jgi:hypothetical protein
VRSPAAVQVLFLGARAQRDDPGSRAHVPPLRFLEGPFLGRKYPGSASACCIRCITCSCTLHVLNTVGGGRVTARSAWTHWVVQTCASHMTCAAPNASETPEPNPPVSLCSNGSASSGL